MIKLTKREKILGFTLMGVGTVLLLYVFLVEPALERVNTLSRVIPRKKNDLTKLRNKADEYTALHNKLENLRAQTASQEKTFKLLPALEAQLKKCGLSDNIVTMEQQVVPLKNSYEKTVVEISLKELSLSQLIDFLSKTKSSNRLVKTNTLHIKNNPKKKRMLDVTVEVYVVNLS